MADPESGNPAEGEENPTGDDLSPIDAETEASAAGEPKEAAPAGEAKPAESADAGNAEEEEEADPTADLLLLIAMGIYVFLLALAAIGEIFEIEAISRFF